ncbi:MAG: DUF1987 domain-containing protein [Bacteroidales bacterium]|nr:DUF1987 domain-containing protein [Bacteroidales bacterium]
MERLFVEGTEYLPTVDFSLDGKLKLEGKAIPEDAVTVFSPLIAFVDALEVDRVLFDINLYYFNTSSSKKLMEMLRHLDANQKINHIQVNWHFEAGDEDSVETAEIYEELLFRTDFRYLEYAEAV